MKSTLFLFLQLVSFLTLSAQSNQWTWVSGDNISNQKSVFGTKGVPAPGNMPGAREESVSWTDAAGNLWLYGGADNTSGTSVFMNDLWKYTPSTGLWTWVGGDMITNQRGVYGVKGVPAPGNMPGAREESISWTDATGNLWLYGGVAYGTSELNDLWKYTPASGLWTWVTGDSTTSTIIIYGTKGVSSPLNKPGARYGAVSWTDASSNLWFFGGIGSTTGGRGFMNDLWKYNIPSGQWTWMSGDSFITQPGVYGTKGIPSAANKPGARLWPVSWTDASNNLWLFGGTGTNIIAFNDLWKYTVSTGQWTWISGDSISSQFGVYGTKGMPASANKPGAREESITWTDASGYLWLFGGDGFSANSVGDLNDLWKFDILTGQWAWISGDNTPSMVGVYGTKGVPAPTNKPGARSGAVSWKDASGNLVLFGGIGYSASGVALFNDLWKFTLPGTTVPTIQQTIPFSVIQNPVQGFLLLRVQLPSEQQLTVQVRDINGHLQMREVKTATAGSSLLSIPVNGLERGTYLISIQSQSLNSTRTFIKL